MPYWRIAARRAGRTVVAASCLASVLAPVATRAFAETPNPTLHVVQPGETLSDIADSSGVDSATLVSLNALDDADVLSVGQSIKVPGRSESAPAAAASVAGGAGPVSGAAAPTAPAAAAAARTGTTAGSARTYTVAAGDTLWAVAQQLATTTAALADANHLADPDHLVAGTQLLLPSGAVPQPATAPAASSGAAAPAAAGSPGSAAAASGPAPKRSLLVSYTVQPGETLSQIAHHFDAPADAIAQASGLDDPNRLAVGTILKVPLPGREHVVQAGETLRDIAAQEKVDLGSLVDFNALDDPELIHIGQLVMVPAPPNGLMVASNNQPAPKPPTPPAPSAPAAGSGADVAAAQASSTASPAPAATAATGAATSATAAAARPAATSASTLAAAGAGTPGSGGAKSGGPVAVQKTAAPVAVVAPPPGAPTDGLAGVGLKLLGSPYVWGGSAPSGFDCSGFVWYVARQAGKQLSRGMFGEYNAGAHPAREELKPGDLVFFQNTYSAGLSHNGIYIGNGQFVHAADEAAGVTVSSLGAAYWSGHWFGATRLP